MSAYLLDALDSRELDAVLANHPALPDANSNFGDTPIDEQRVSPVSRKPNKGLALPLSAGLGTYPGRVGAFHRYDRRIALGLTVERVRRHALNEQF